MSPLLLATLPALAAIGMNGNQVREVTGIDTGLAVVLNDINMAVDLADDGQMQVHLLVHADESHRNAMQRRLNGQGFGGRIMVAPFPNDGRLPYPDRFVNLVFGRAETIGDSALSMEETQRVTALRGVVLFKTDSWEQYRHKPKQRLDNWTHRFYDATGNAVSRDLVAAAPQSVQWQHGPAMEDGTADGKIPRVYDGYHLCLEAQTGELVCRDAGNGSLLWRRFVGARQNNDLAIVDGLAYLWHDPDTEIKKDGKYTETGPLTAFDVTTGELVQTFDEGVVAGAADVIEYKRPGHGDRIFKSRPVAWFVVRDDVILQSYGPELIVLDRKTGKRRWSKQLEGATWFSPALAGEKVLAAESVVPARRGRHDGSWHVQALTAWRLGDGKQLWRNLDVHPQRPVTDKGVTTQSRSEFKPISVSGDLVLLHTSSYQFRTGGSIAVLEIGSGNELWREEFAPKQLYTQGSQRAIIRREEVVVLDGTGAFRRNARTGDPVGDPLKRDSKFRRLVRLNGACTASRATDNLLICNGCLFVGPDSQIDECFGARGQCGQGVVPANGMIFVPPTACDCGDYTRGYQALSPALPGQVVSESDRHVQGTATVSVKADIDITTPTDWPVFLRDSRRSNSSAESLQIEEQSAWQQTAATVHNDALNTDRRQSERYLGALSAPVLAAGTVVVSAPESHQVLAFDAKLGKRLWSFPTGGRVDSPPTIAHGAAIFGCDDGWVYAVSLADGELAWRTLVAPTDGLAMHHGHLASAFPIPGSVLVSGDRVVAVAGHHSDIGGLHCRILHVATGETLAQRVIRSDTQLVAANGLAVLDDSGEGFWIGRQLHLSFDIEDLPSDRDAVQAPVWFDRSGSRIRFRTDLGRGGSTHGWKGATRLRGWNHRWLSAHRFSYSDEAAFGLRDPKHAYSSSREAIVWRTTLDSPRDTSPAWHKLHADLGSQESYSAIAASKDRVYVAGGARDGSSGFIQIIDSGSGKLVGTRQLPSRVTENGLAIADGQLIVCCEQGQLLCFR